MHRRPGTRTWQGEEAAQSLRGMMSARGEMSKNVQLKYTMQERIRQSVEILLSMVTVQRRQGTRRRGLVGLDVYRGQECAHNSSNQEKCKKECISLSQISQSVMTVQRRQGTRSGGYGGWGESKRHEACCLQRIRNV